MAVTTGMVGAGFYDEHSAPQWAATEVVVPWLEDAIAEMALAEGSRPVAFADFGCSEGANSIRVMQRLVPAMRARTPLPIVTVHSDLPTNDYRNLLRNLRPDGRAVFGDRVFSVIAGGSMYEQLLPPGSIDIATTFNAIAFFSRRPLDRLPGYILPNGPSRQRGNGVVTAAELDGFAAQAASDLEAFLRARAAELVPGGRLLVEVFGAEDGWHTTHGPYDILNDALLEMLDAGLVDRDALERYYMPVYTRRLDELTAPVDGGGVLASTFRLDRADCYEVAVPFVAAWRRGGDTADYAQAYCDFFRAFTEPVLRQALPSLDPDRLMSDLYGRAERLVREHADRYPFRYIAVAMLLTRR